jgi:hypothetical protein
MDVKRSRVVAVLHTPTAPQKVEKASEDIKTRIKVAEGRASLVAFRSRS